MLETDLSLRAEISLYYDLFVPVNHAGPAPLLIAVHGYGAHKRYMMREARAIAPENYVIASVQAPHQHFRKTEDGYRVGFGWLTDFRPDESVELHQKFLLGLIEKLKRENVIDPGNISLYGFSQACALNFRFAFTYQDVLKNLIGVCGGIPGDLDENPNYAGSSVNTLYLYGNNDEFYTNEKFRDNEQKLRSWLPNLTAKQYDAGHEIMDEMRFDIKEFLSKSE